METKAAHSVEFFNSQRGMDKHWPGFCFTGLSLRKVYKKQAFQQDPDEASVILEEKSPPFSKLRHRNQFSWSSGEHRSLEVKGLLAPSLCPQSSQKLHRLFCPSLILSVALSWTWTPSLGKCFTNELYLPSFNFSFWDRVSTKVFWASLDSVIFLALASQGAGIINLCH